MTAEPVAAISRAILQRQRFIVTSHARPDGDAIGSQMAMAYALRQLGKDVQMVSADPAPPQFQVFPGVRDIQVSATVNGQFDAVIVMECGDLSRTGVEGLDQYFASHRSPALHKETAHHCSIPGRRMQRDGVRRYRALV